jgi:hypothetical protein
MKPLAVAVIFPSALGHTHPLTPSQPLSKTVISMMLSTNKKVYMYIRQNARSSPRPLRGLLQSRPWNDQIFDLPHELVGLLREGQRQNGMR